MLSDVSYAIDVGEQDKQLAQQIQEDQQTIAAVHQTVQDMRAAQDDLRLQTAAQKVKLDQQLKALKAAQAELHRLEVATKRALNDPERRLRRSCSGTRRTSPRRTRRDRVGAASARVEDLRPRRAAVPAGQHPVEVQRLAHLADERHRHPGLRLHRRRLRAAARELPALSQRHRHRRDQRVRDADQGVRRRPDRVHRLELRRRLGSGLDRDRRPLVEPDDVVRPHEGRTRTRAGSRPARWCNRARSSATRTRRGTRRVATSTGWWSSTATS